MILTLIYPSVGRKENTPYVRAWQMEPLSMALLASLTPPGVEVRFPCEAVITGEKFPHGDSVYAFALP